jgi:hypothetical protein
MMMLLLGGGWAALFHLLGEGRARSFGPAVFLFTPFAYGVVCGLPAVFLGIFTAIPVTALLARLLLGWRRFTEYLFWDEGRLAAGGGITPDGVIRMLSHLAVLAGVLCVVFVCLVMNWYARFTDEGIAIKDLFAFREEAYSYAGVTQMVLTTHEQQDRELVPRENVYLRFADGRTWRTGTLTLRPRAEWQRFLDFLQAKTQ